jgi:hypothetical protein
MQSMASPVTNTHGLIDAVVRQTMVLIAQLATAGGQRAKLANVANHVFLDLVSELEGQGVGQKVIADMFGLALRTYQRKRQRLGESVTEKGRSLWEAVLSHVQERGNVGRDEILERFRYDDESSVRGVLNDLVETGLVYRTGHAERSRYRAATPEELGLVEELDPLEVTAALVWVLVHRHAPVTATDLGASMSLEARELAPALARLIEDGRVVAHDQDGVTYYECEDYVIPYGSDVGWAAAVFDHYQAVVSAICAKLTRGTTRAGRTDAIGGSTFQFDVWDGHPFEDEVVGLLSELRERAHTLRGRVVTYNQDHPDSAPPKRVVLYMGQNVIEEEP